MPVAVAQVLAMGQTLTKPKIGLWIAVGMLETPAGAPIAHVALAAEPGHPLDLDHAAAAVDVHTGAVQSADVVPRGNAVRRHLDFFQRPPAVAAARVQRRNQLSTQMNAAAAIAKVELNVGLELLRARFHALRGFVVSSPTWSLSSSHISNALRAPGIQRGARALRRLLNLQYHHPSHGRARLTAREHFNANRLRLDALEQPITNR